MKNLNAILFLSLITFLISGNALSQTIEQGELMLVNNTGTTGYTISVDMYPVGAIFNGKDEYTFKSAHPISTENDKIFGLNHEPLSNNTSQKWFIRGNFDKSQQIDYCDFSLGYGKYRVDIYDATYTNKLYTFDVDFSDANFTGVSTADYYQQLCVDYYSSSDVKFKFYGSETKEVPISNGGTISVWEQRGTPNSAKTPNKGDFTDFSENGTEYHSYPLDATKSGFFQHITPENVGMNLRISHFDASLNSEYNEFNFKNCIFKVESGKTFTMNNEQTILKQMIISGREGKFITSPNSIILFPDYFLIKIEDGTSLECNGSIFKSIDVNNTVNGIQLTGAGNSFIKNCTFQGIAYPISSNKNGSNELVIDNNTFEKISAYSIYILNTNNLLISNNHFLFEGLTGVGILIDNGGLGEEDNNSVPIGTSINIIGNDFHYGLCHLQIIGTVDLSPVYIHNNYFYEIPPQSMILFVFTVGTFSNNYIYYPNTDGVYIAASSLDFLGNYIYSNNYSDIVDLGGPTYLTLAPSQTDKQLIWKGGGNSFLSNDENNLSSNMNYPSGYYYTNFGGNAFNINNEHALHIQGFFSTSAVDYLTYGNCWYADDNPHVPNVVVYNEDHKPMNVLYNGNPAPDCKVSKGPIVERIISDKGYGIKDTILVTQSDSIPQPSSDVALYGTGIKNLEYKNYNLAITNFKDLINLYPESKYLGDCVFKLYECYLRSDTNHTQSFRNIIFGNLKSYLENKIQQYSNNNEFVDVAYDFSLKSDVKIKEYIDALDGYDFIVNNSPDPTEVLLASLCYMDVEELIGSGGGEKMSDEEPISKIENTGLSPIKDIVKRSYSRIDNIKKEREESELKNSKDVASTKSELDKKRNYENKITEQAHSNIISSKSLNSEQKRELKIKCLSLLANKNTKNNSTIKPISVPMDYSLSQNYPNPFNPVTRITFSIEKMAITSLKIYDVLGREVKVLVNEIRQPGTYSIDFDGSMLSSGVYFYRLESGSFHSVKRMMLIK